MGSEILSNFIKDISYSGIEVVGRYYSNYRAFVFSNEDPENVSRLKLVIPQIAGDEPYEIWAFPKGVFSGENYGVQVLPQKGDLVWVEFEMGDPQVPIWSHGHFGENEKPTDKKYTDKNSYWFQTPKGHSIMINDTEEYIYAGLKGDKKYIKIHKDKVTVKWEDTEINLDDLIQVKTQNENLYSLLNDLFTFLESQTFTNSGGITGPTNQLSQLQQLHKRLPKLFKQ